MPLPPDFKKFADNFGDYSANDSWELEQMIDFSIQQMTDSEPFGASEYITELLGGRLSTEDLNRIWRRTNARVHVENGYPPLLRMAKSMMDRLLHQRKSARPRK